MTSKSLLMKASLIMISAATLATSAVSRADGEQMIEIAPAGVVAGNQLVIGQGKCPCIRWTIGVDVGKGVIETQDVLISTEGLFKFQQANSLDFQQVGSRIFTAGAAELLVKQGHVGLGFKGVSFGNDKDRGFTEFMRAGLYVMASIANKAESIRADFRTGYDYDHVQTVTNKEATRHFFTNEAVITVGNPVKPIYGQFKASVALNPESFFATNSMRLASSAAINARILDFSDFEMHVGAQAGATYDPFLDVLGIRPVDVTGMITMDLTWVGVVDRAN